MPALLVTPFFRAIRDLSGDRINSQYGINGIPHAAKLDYLIAIGVEDIAHAYDILTEVDQVFVQLTNQKLKKMVENDG